MAGEKSLLARFLVVVGISLVMLTPSMGLMQSAHNDSKDDIDPSWHKYTNTHFGLSFFYPHPYKPIVASDRCKNNYYAKYLLCLWPRSDSQPAISVSVVVAVPFHIAPGAGDVMPTRQTIGRLVFYCGVVGSMGVGFSDSCVLNLRGRTLQFLFNPPDGMQVDHETKHLETTMLKTLRIF
jgi:hypothetical protein